MPKPRRKKETEKPRLKPPKPDKKPGGGVTAGLGGFGKRMPGRGRIPDDDQRTLVGAAVFGIILIVLVAAGYYFLVYGPYQSSLQSAKDAKINEVNSYYKGPMALNPTKQLLLAEIDRAVTTDQALAVDVLGPATADWRQYQTGQINTQKDPYGRVMITYQAGGKKNAITKVSDAQKIINQADASVLANMKIETPDTVVIPIILDRQHAAGGLINVGDAVDIYVNLESTTTTPTNTTNQTNQTNTTTTSSVNKTTPLVSGATVLALLRSKADPDSNSVIKANLSQGQSIAVAQLATGSQRSQWADTDVEELLKAGASRTWDDSTINALLAAYGVRLSDFERAANLGDLNAQYMILLEVPRENALFIIQNQNATQLTISTLQAPTWMSTVLKQIYGSGAPITNNSTPGTTLTGN